MDNEDAFELWALDDDERALVADEIAAAAPQMFAICRLRRDEADMPVAGRVLAWGLAQADGAEVFTVDGRMHGSYPSVDRAMERFSYLGEVGLVRP